MTSSLSVVDLKGNYFGRSIYPPSLIVIACILAKLWGWGVESARPQKTKQKPRLDRVKVAKCLRKKKLLCIVSLYTLPSYLLPFLPRTSCGFCASLPGTTNVIATSYPDNYG